ncbi:hypothetical protein GCM10022270_23370 [Terriglobus aquaticus]
MLFAGLAHAAVALAVGGTQAGEVVVVGVDAFGKGGGVLSLRGRGACAQQCGCGEKQVLRCAQDDTPCE